MQPAAARELSGAEAQLSAEQLRTNFLWFAVNFAVNHGVVTTPIVIATSVLAGSSGYVGNALLNIFTMVGSFFLGAPAVAAFGLRGGVLFGMLNYCLYALLFATAAFLGRAGKDKLSSSEEMIQYIVFSVGSAFGGIAAGVLWTAQGAYFTRTVDLLHGIEGGNRQDITATLASRFAVLYLALELVAKLTWSLMAALKVAGWIIAVCYTVVGALALMSQCRVLKLSSPQPNTDLCQRVKVAASIWPDPVLWLVAGINLTFGFSAAFMNGYISGHFASDLGKFAPTLLASLTALFAGIFSHVFGWLSTRVGKGPVVVIGSLSFLGIPFCFFALGCCSGWGWWLTILYILQGSGRAVYESTNKGIFSDLFTSSNAAGAFANQMLQVTGSFAACFFLSSVLKGPTLAWIALVLAALTPVGYFAAVGLRKSQAARAERCSQSQAALVPVSS